MAFTFIDLFAGVGGFHYALKQLGGNCVFASEIDPHASNIYSLNWHTTKNNFEIAGDIKPLTEGTRVQVPKHDVLTGGFPCQPFSKSGNQLGVNEARGTLFYNILRILETRKPKLVLLENVRNLVGPRHFSDYQKMIMLLRQLGYAVSTEPVIVSPHMIPKSKGGTPQHRERVFIGAIYVGKNRAQKLSNMEPLISREEIRNSNLEWDIKEFLESANKTLKISHSELEITNSQVEAIRMWEDFLKKFRKLNKKNPPGFPMWTEFWQTRDAIRIPKSTPEWKKDFILKNVALYESNQDWINKWRSNFDLNSFIPSQRKFEWQAGDLDSIYSGLIQFRPSGVRVKRPNYVPAFVAISQTPVLGWESRELSEQECAVLQGFPSSFQFGNQKRPLSLKQIGNAVHPATARFVFQSLVTRAIDLGLPWAEDILN